MEIHLPDPHPGRCKNFRHDTGRVGRSLRCLEREGTAHVCRFDPPTPPSNERHSYSKSSTKPEPWVVPPR